MKEGNKQVDPTQKHGLGFNAKDKNKSKKKAKMLEKEDLIPKKAEEERV